LGYKIFQLKKKMKLFQNINIIAVLILKMAFSLIGQSFRTNATLSSACNATNKEACNIRAILKINHIKNRFKKAVDAAFWETPFDKDDENPLKNQNDYDENDDDHEYETLLGDNEDHDIVDFYMKEIKPSASLEEFYLQAKEDRETYHKLEKQRLSAKILKFFHTVKEFVFKLFLLNS
jgi:hypothetical protein